MRYVACVASKDTAFAQFIRLTLLTRVRSVTVIDNWEQTPIADLYVIDLDTLPLPEHLEGKLLCCSFTKPKPADFPYLWADRPFRPARLLALLDLAYEGEDQHLTLCEDRLSATLEGREVELSPREFALLSLLHEAKGAYVSREDILTRVWGEGTHDASLVNVYIHYLRQKLEPTGKRYIHSARNGGYALVLGEEE